MATWTPLTARPNANASLAAQYLAAGMPIPDIARLLGYTERHINRLLNAQPETPAGREAAQPAAFPPLGEHACKSADQAMFFPGGNGAAEVMHERAKRVCNACPVRQECQDYALAHDVYGVWGALTHRQRKAIQAGRAAAPERLKPLELTPGRAALADLYAELDARRQALGLPWWRVANLLRVSVPDLYALSLGVGNATLRRIAEAWLDQKSEAA